MVKKTENALSVADEENKTLAVGGSNELAFLGEDDFAGNGFEGVDKDAFAIPFIQVLQKMSPRVDEDAAEYIPGAKAGMFFNTVTGKLYDGKEGVQFIPCAFKRTYIQWGGRDGDGGFKGEISVEDFNQMVADKKVAIVNGKAYLLDEKGEFNEKKSDYFADTRSHYVIERNAETGESGMAVIALSSSLTKASRTLMTLLHAKRIDTANGKRQPPTFANLVRMTTVPMSNEKGTWSGVKFALEGLVPTQQEFLEAKEFYNNINEGKVKADHSKADREGGDGEVGGASEAEGF